MSGEDMPVTIHMYGPYPRKNLAPAAHKAAWSPRIRTSEGERLAKDLQGSKRAWKGKRILEQFNFEDLLPIPPLELKRGIISEEGQSNIRKALKPPRQSEEQIRSSMYKETKHDWADMCSWVARQIREGIEQQTTAYDNKWYVQNAYEVDEKGYANQKPRSNRTKPMK